MGHLCLKASPERDPPAPTQQSHSYVLLHPKGTDDPFGAGPLLSAGAWHSHRRIRVGPVLCSRGRRPGIGCPPCGAGGVPFLGMWKAFGSRKPLCYVLLLRGGEPWGG